MELRLLCLPLRSTFEKLFPKTFSRKVFATIENGDCDLTLSIVVQANIEFLMQVQQAFAASKWRRFVHLLKNAVRLVEKKYVFREEELEERRAEDRGKEDESKEPAKKPMRPELRARWLQFSSDLNQFDVKRQQLKNNFAFTFVEGALVSAVRNGHWVLLDEVWTARVTQVVMGANE